MRAPRPPFPGFKEHSREFIHRLPAGADPQPNLQCAPSPCGRLRRGRLPRRRASAFRPGSSARRPRRLWALGESRARSALATWRLDRLHGQPRRRDRGVAGKAPERGLDARLSLGRSSRLCAGRTLAGVDRGAFARGDGATRRGGRGAPRGGGVARPGHRRDARVRIGVGVELRLVGTIPCAARRSARGAGGEGGRPADRDVGHGVRDELRQRRGDGVELLRITDRNGDRDRNRPGERRAGLRCRLGHAPVGGRVGGPLPGAGVARRCGRPGGSALA